MSNEIKEQDYSILLVDDDVEKVMDDQVDLQKEGYKTYTAHTGEDAIKIMKSSTHIDVLIIDYYMGVGLNGEETVTKIREFNSEVIIVIQTGYIQEQPALRMLKSLKIQGYYDKSEGRTKLLVWVLSAIRACEQMREVKRATEKLEIAQYILQQMREDQTRVIEQVRLASLGQKMGSIFHDLSNSISAVQTNIDIIDSHSSSIFEHTLAIENSPLLVDIQNSTKEIEKRCNSCQQRLKYVVEMRNNVVAQSGQEAVSKWEKFPISEMIEQVKFFAEDDVKRYRCTISIDNQVSDSVKISGKKVSLVQALGNLITNSAQAYEKGGSIKVSITEKDGTVEFIIKDWAGGVLPHVKEKLFTEMVTTKGINGSGVGVYSTYLTIVDYFGGKMWFDSIEGEGTTFYITIPCVTS